MERGANTFPFHNFLPYSESNEGLFLYFYLPLNWIKIKVGGDSCYPHICDTKIQKVSSPYYREDSARVVRVVGIVWTVSHSWKCKKASTILRTESVGNDGLYSSMIIGCLLSN